jgi:hypothetical protein
MSHKIAATVAHTIGIDMARTSASRGIRFAGEDCPRPDRSRLAVPRCLPSAELADPAKSRSPTGPPTLLGRSLRCQPGVAFSIGAKQPPTDSFLDERQCLPCLTGVGFGGLSTELGCRQSILLGVYT